MDAIKNELAKLPSNFWIYNYVASLVFFLIGDHHSIIKLLIFPLALILVEYLISNFWNNSELNKHVGFYPLNKEDLGQLLITVIVNYVIWHISIILVIAGGAFIYLQQKGNITR